MKPFEARFGCYSAQKIGEYAALTISQQVVDKEG
jgi:hypothetical protein